ncbi:hypothetical protein JCM18897A_27040 [Streptomyces sp. JCM 18897]
MPQPGSRNLIIGSTSNSHRRENATPQIFPLNAPARTGISDPHRLGIVHEHRPGGSGHGEARESGVLAVADGDLAVLA